MRTVALDAAISRTDLSNGLVVVTERLPGVRSAAAGVWVRTASGHESRDKMGVSHLLEHMVFKGTAKRSARDIALALESRGGSLDAYTSRDQTAFQAHVLDQDLPLALDVLTDLVHSPLLRSEDLELERNVVLEELSGVRDTPDDFVSELWSEMMWPEHPYGYSILGTPASVAALGTGDLRALHERGYHPGNTVIAVAGNVDHAAVLDTLGALGWFAGDARAAVPAVTPSAAARGLNHAEPDDLQQVHAIVGTDTVAAIDARRWGLSLMATVLGGGMSSRLFQKVREELGLCYAVYAWHSCYRSAGTFGVYVGTSPRTAAQALTTIGDELRRVCREGISPAELADGKGQLHGQVLLALESTVSRMARVASHALNEDEYHSIDEVLKLIDGVTVDAVAELAAEFLAPERMTTVRLGPVE